VAPSTIDQMWLEGLCRRTDDILWDSYSFALGAAEAPWPRVMFPAKGHERRVGEQEARFAFVAALLSDPASAPWAFAAEAPTRLSYRFAARAGGPRAQRALTDLALYRGSDDAPALAVEFKSGGRSGKSEQDDSIKKDVAKVLAEQPPALWFHVLRGVNDATLQGLLRTLDGAISQLSNPYKLGAYLASGKTPEPRAKTIAFHLCVLNPDVTVSIHKVLDYIPGKPKDEFFTLVTTATGAAPGAAPETAAAGAPPETAAAGAPLEIADGQGWSVYRPVA
jgi:hypothetical protein